MIGDDADGYGIPGPCPDLPDLIVAVVGGDDVFLDQPVGGKIFLPREGA